MQTDSFFIIGKSHSVCEDYACHGDNFIVVSDGCSSSKNTDVGARLLCHTAARLIKLCGNNPFTYSQFGQRLSTCVSEQLRLLDLPLSCMDATLLTSFVINDQLYTYIFGDGYYRIKFVDNTVHYGRLIFNGNAPFYLSYWLDPKRTEGYVKKFGSEVECEVTKQVGDLPPNTTSTELNLFLGKEDSIIPLLPIDSIDNILLMSDGVESFLNYDVSPPMTIEDSDILDSLSAFKNIKGEYITRRTKAALKRYKKKGIDHYDDLSVAGIYFDRS